MKNAGHHLQIIAAVSEGRAFFIIYPPLFLEKLNPACFMKPRYDQIYVTVPA